MIMALARGELPAAIGALEAPGPVKVWLSNCWEREPTLRPPMKTIQERIRGYLQTAMSMPSHRYTTLQRHAQKQVSLIDCKKLEVSLVRALLIVLFYYQLIFHRKMFL